MSRALKVLVMVAAILLMSGSVYAMEANSSNGYSGTYLGVLTGYSWVDMHYSEPGYPNYGLDPDFDGFVGGIYLGYNYRMDNTIYGIETDLVFGDLSKGAEKNNQYNDYSAFDIDWNAHVRAKAGLIFNNTLLYVAGGLALADLTVDDKDPGWGKDDATHTGWTIGAGIEYMMTDNLLLRFEYLYDDYGSEKYTIKGGNYSYDAKVKDFTVHTTRIGLSYNF